jgi:uncharacterized Fe-S cluster-containing protein
MNTPHFPRLIDNDEGEITVTINDVEVRGWSYKNRDEQCLKIRMAREYCEGWHDGFARALDRASEIAKETLGKNISVSVAPSLTVVSDNDPR